MSYYLQVNDFSAFNYKSFEHEQLVCMLISQVHNDNCCIVGQSIEAPAMFLIKMFGGARYWIHGKYLSRFISFGDIERGKVLVGIGGNQAGELPRHHVGCEYEFICKSSNLDRPSTYTLVYEKRGGVDMDCCRGGSSLIRGEKYNEIRSEYLRVIR